MRDITLILDGTEISAESEIEAVKKAYTQQAEGFEQINLGASADEQGWDTILLELVYDGLAGNADALHNAHKLIGAVLDGQEQH